jgi:triosephosphate isomerase
VILCCGEPEERREEGKHEKFVLNQLRLSLPESMDDAGERLTVAYEPIWAIGTGRTPTLEDIAAMHAAIRGFLVDRFGEEQGGVVRILYGGSVKPDNAREILAVANVGGALVGGASLAAESFMNIALAAADGEDS